MENSEEKSKGTKKYGVKPIVILLLFLSIVFLVFSISRILGNIAELQQLTWLVLILSIIAIPAIPYGFLKRKRWILIYTFLASIIYTSVSIMFLVNTGNVILWYPLFVLTLISLISLGLSSTRKYFIQEVYQHGEFTLHKKLVPMKSGSTRVFYFFSKGSSDKGTPCPLPEGYEVHINKKSGVPYLKKKI